MSTSEKSTNWLGLCLCGSGELREHVDSPDNGYSRTSFTYELACAACAKDWELDDGGRLVNRAAKAASFNASLAYQGARARLALLLADAIDTILQEKRIATPGEERELLKNAGLCDEGPIRYKRLRVAGQGAGALCIPTKNEPWICRELQDERYQAAIASQRIEITRLEAEDVRTRQSMLETVRDLRAERSARPIPFTPPQ